MMAAKNRVPCWAQSLGDCAGGPSREHIISKSQFNSDKIAVEGFSWCEKQKIVGLASLVAKNLCVHHNNALSPVDAEAKRFKDALGEIYSNPSLPVRVRLDARLVERWLLKTTINLALQDPESGIDLSDEIVRRAFGCSPTPRAQGFFAIAELGDRQRQENSIRFESIMRRDSGRLVLGAFILHGWKALYAFEGAPPVNGAMRVRQWNYAPHWLRFRWSPNLETDDTVMPSIVREKGDTPDSQP
jgi:hypothetical protein